MFILLDDKIEIYSKGDKHNIKFKRYKGNLYNVEMAKCGGKFIVVDDKKIYIK